MKMTQQHEEAEMAVLETALAKSAGETFTLSAGFMMRVLADADALQPRPEPIQIAHLTLLQRLNAVFGGWQGLGGLAVAACAGLWIGLRPPVTFPDAGALLLGFSVVETFEDSGDINNFGWDSGEG